MEYFKNKSFKNFIKDVKSGTEIAARIARLSVLVSGKPTVKDYLSLAVEGCDAFCDVYTEFTKTEKEEVSSASKNRLIEELKIDGWDWFPVYCNKYVIPFVRDFKFVLNVNNSKIKVLEGTFKSTRLRFLVDKNHDFGIEKFAKGLDHFYYRLEDEDSLRKEISDHMWDLIGSKEISLTKDFSIEPIYNISIEEILDHSFIRSLEDRTVSFLNEGAYRSFLINGVPGTGKSQSIRKIVSNLNFRTLHIPNSAIHAFLRFNRDGSGQDILNVIKTVRPDAIIIDDFDRLPKDYHADFLSILEGLKHMNVVKFLFVTTNKMNHLTNALLRPGRIDDLIEIPPLEEDFVKSFLGENKDLYDQVSNLPISFLNDLNLKIKALGRVKAEEEIPQMLENFQLLNKEESPTLD